MCTVSVIAADWQYRHPQWIAPNTSGAAPNTFIPFTDYVPRSEFEALKHELESLKALLKSAKQYDEETGQADCED